MNFIENILILAIWILVILYLTLELNEKTEEYNALFEVYQDKNNICKEMK